MILVTATAQDAPAIANILSNWIASTSWMPRVHSRASEKRFARMLVDRGWTTVARDEGRVAGFLSREEGEIHALYLAPRARGKGIGKALLDHAKEGCEVLSLYTFQMNEDAQRFYLREGFAEVFRTDGRGNDEHLPDIRYDWRQPHD